MLPGPNAAPDYFTEGDIETFYSSNYAVHYNSCASAHPPVCSRRRPSQLNFRARIQGFALETLRMKPCPTSHTERPLLWCSDLLGIRASG